MSRQLDLKAEELDTKRRDALMRVLDFELVGILETQGIELLGMSITHDAYSCRLVLRAVIGGEPFVCFVYSGNIADSFLRAASDARNDNLRWGADKYAKPVV